MPNPTPPPTGPRLIRFPPSANIAGILYNADDQTLTVEFAKSGAVYRYDGCTEEMALGFQTAMSATKYLETYIASQCASTRIA